MARKIGYTFTAVDTTRAAFRGLQSSLSKTHKLGMGTIRAVRGIGLAATGAVTAIGALVKVNADAADRLGKTASKLGINVELLQQLRFAADQTGIAQNTLDMAMQRFIRRVGEAQNGTGEAKAALEELGIQLRNNDGTLRSTEEVLFDVSDGLKNADDASTRLRLAFKFFDSEGAALVNTLKDGSDGLKEYFDQANDLGLVIDQDTTKAFEAFTDQMSILWQQIKVVTQYVIAAFLPTLLNMAAAASNAIKKFAEMAGGVKQLGVDIATYLIEKVENATIALAEFSNALIGTIDQFGWFEGAIIDVEKLRGKFAGLKTSVSETLEPVKQVKEEIEEIVELPHKMSQPVASFVNDIMDTQKTLANFTKSSMKKLEDSIFDSLKKGKLHFQDFANFVIEELMRIAIKRAIIAPITGKFEAFFGGIFDGGGFTGQGVRAGGLDGKGGFAAILHPNETVIDHTQGQKISSSGATVNFNISTVDAAGFDELLASRKNLITGIINNAMNTRGKLGVV